MDKILSARVSEGVLQRINALASELKMTKKAVIEKAISFYADNVEKEHQIDIFQSTLGIWGRSEPPEETVERAKKAFRSSMKKHQ